MQPQYDESARRQSVSLSANSDLMRRVQEEKGDLSALFEESMVAFLSKKVLERWKLENRGAFESYNKMIEEDGTLSDDLGLL